MKHLLQMPEVDPSACALEEEADLNSERPVGKTGLHLAAIHDCPEIAQALTAKDLEVKCPLDTQDEKVQVGYLLHLLVHH